MSTRPGLRVLSAMLGRLGFASKAGFGFRGRRDYWSALGYPELLTPTDYRERYERGGISRRIVRVFPESTWAGGAALVEDQDPEVTTDFEQTFSDLAERLSLWPRLMRADVLSGIGRFGVLVIGAPGDIEGPLPSSLDPDDVLFFQPYSEESVQGIEFEDDHEDPRFGQPLSYQISIGNPEFISGGTQQIARTQTKKVHWTRTIHFADNLLDNEVYGEPRLRPVWNYLDDLLKIVGGGSEAAWKRADPGLWVDLDKELVLDKEEEESLDDEVQDYLHSLTRVIRTRGANLQLLQSTVAGFGSNVEALEKLIAATIDVPSRILTGSERGELASTQDRRTFADRISARRSAFAEPIIRELANRLVSVGVLNEPGSLRIVWSDIEELDEREKSEVAGRIATANLRQSQGNQPPIMTADEIRDRILGLKPMGNGAAPPGEAEVEEDNRARDGNDDTMRQRTAPGREESRTRLMTLREAKLKLRRDRERQEAA